MRRFFFLCISALLFTTSCYNDKDEIPTPNGKYTTIQEKALSILNGIWASNEITVEYEYGNGNTISMMVVPSDTIIFLSGYPAPQTFYTYDFLQGKEIASFDACGTCELRVGSGTIPYFSPNCYFFISPQGDALKLYNVETEQLVRSYGFHAESSTRFYAGASNGAPIIFNKQ